VRAGMHRGKPLIPQSRDDTTRQPAPNVRPERPVRARRRALPANLRSARSAVRDGGQVERRQPRNLDHGTQDRGAGCRCPGRSAARERGGVGLGGGGVCITFGYVKPTPPGSRRAEAEGGARQGVATVFFVNAFEEKTTTKEIGA